MSYHYALPNLWVNWHPIFEPSIFEPPTVGNTTYWIRLTLTDSTKTTVGFRGNWAVLVTETLQSFGIMTLSDSIVFKPTKGQQGKTSRD